MCLCLCEFVSRCEAVFNKNDICLGVRVRVSVVFVNLCECVILWVCVSACMGMRGLCVSVSVCFFSFGGSAALCPRSKYSGLSGGEPLPQFPLGGGWEAGGSLVPREC